MRSIPYGRQHINQGDIDAVVAALRNPLITQGPTVARFEQRLCEVTGAGYAVVFNSGTAALHAAYFAIGVGPTNGVLTSPITFAATANAALYLGAPVRFCDIDSVHCMLDPALAERMPDHNFGVIAPVHYAGHVAPMVQIAELAARRGWRVVVDAAHALGAHYRAQDGSLHRVGACAHSDLCCFSFHPVKHITTGEGGAVTTNDERLYRRLLRFRSHGVSRDPSDMQSNEGPWYYEQLDLGFNYRLTDFQCALGMSQLARLEQFVSRRRALAARYDEALDAHPHIHPLLSPPGSIGSYHLYVVRLPSAIRRRVFEEMREAGVGVQVHYIPVYRHPYYRATGFADTVLTNAEAFYAEAVSLPLFPRLAECEVDEVTDTLKGLVATEMARCV
jgi:UDP-4-amino-4,6-dideoxy-N-acetyl-beta-L-altrosamine transaminase